MQLIPRYLVKNRVTIVADLAGFITEYKPVYQRHVKVYKGIENTIEFKLLNADQKPINTQNYIPMFCAFDENNDLIIEKEAQVLDDGSTATKGLFTVTITENELLNVKHQYLSYTIYLIDNDSNRVITYTDTHFGNSGIINIASNAFPGPKQSVIVNTFTKVDVNNNDFVSSAIDADPAINGNSALHTIAVYTSSYVGKIEIQATLDVQVTDNTNWAVIDTIVFDGQESEPVPVNFNGVYNWIRFKTDADPTGKIEKILIRN